jgi:UDP-N-acetylmuramoyl-tripeptide--D-alanyl-D-alanine ligase
MKLLSNLFPINLYLSIFQLEGYDIPRFLKWISKNPFVRKVPQKRGLIYTLKTKLLLTLSMLLVILIFLILDIATGNALLSLAIGVFILTQFYLPLTVSRALLYPIEYLIIRMNIEKTAKKIKSIKNLKVIAITGSYGKTSVKEILYQLIKDSHKTLRTPESYNTILGISKVVDYELDGSYEYFICEMAAYHLHGIQELCRIVPPNYGIITGITSQHLERFGNFKNIVETKFELYDFIADKKNVIFNTNDKNILNEIEKRKMTSPEGYLKVSNVRFSKSGSTFDLIYKERRFPIQTKLFGISNIENLMGAITMALKIGVKIERLVSLSSELKPVANRFVLRSLNRATVVDNTFSSNEQSFFEMIETAKNINGKKVLVTPGLVELGEKETSINSSIGKLSNSIFDKIVLVGNNNRTKSFAAGLKEKPEFIPDTRKDYFGNIEELSKEYDWIFLENDVTENY